MILQRKLQRWFPATNKHVYFVQNKKSVSHLTHSFFNRVSSLDVDDYAVGQQARFLRTIDAFLVCTTWWGQHAAIWLYRRLFDGSRAVCTTLIVVLLYFLQIRSDAFKMRLRVDIDAKKIRVVQHRGKKTYLQFFRFVVIYICKYSTIEEIQKC